MTKFFMFHCRIISQPSSEGFYTYTYLGELYKSPTRDVYLEAESREQLATLVNPTEIHIL